MIDQSAATITRREVIQRVTALLGGVALLSSERLLAFSLDEEALTRAMTQGAGAFTASDIALLDEIAETILPQTSTPGAKAAKTGAFMALIVTDVYPDRTRDVFRAGMRQLDEACAKATGAGFMNATPAQRLTLLQELDREQKAAMDARLPTPSNRYPPPDAPTDEPAHYFRMMKELALLGFFTSELGMTRALRYIEAPGSFDPCAPYAPGDRAWAPHA